MSRPPYFTPNSRNQNNPNLPNRFNYPPPPFNPALCPPPAFNARPLPPQYHSSFPSHPNISTNFGSGSNTGPRYPLQHAPPPPAPVPKAFFPPRHQYHSRPPTLGGEKGELAPNITTTQKNNTNPEKIQLQENFNGCHPLNKNVVSYTKDQKWLAQWIEEKLEDKNNSKIKSSNSPLPNTLSEVHRNVTSYKELLDKFRSTDVPEEEKAAKEALDGLSAKLLDDSYQKQVKMLVQARRKKRLRQRKAKKNQKLKWKEEEIKIDKKRESIIKQEKKEKMDHQLRQEADSVLREVRTKQSEANALLQLVQKLRDLREHRMKRGPDQGFISDDKNNEYFTKITDGLEDMVNKQKQEYKLEERTLTVMLDQHQFSGSINTPASKGLQLTTNLLQDIYFGSKKPLDASLFASYTSASDSPEVFINRRRLWDLYINDEKGSNVPCSWVPPPVDSCKAWKRWMTG